MSPISRGIRNTFRNGIRAFAIIIILSLSIGLALAMLIAHQAVKNKISSVESSVGNTITVSPAGIRGFDGGGNPLTQAQLDKIKDLDHVTSITETLNDRLTSTNTNLKSSIDSGQLGQRFSNNSGQSFTGRFGGGDGTFTPPVTVLGTNDPTNLSATQGGGNFSLKSGNVFSASDSNVALVGTALASKNSLSVGSTFTAYGKTIKVVGIFDSGNTFSNGLLIMPLGSLQTLSSQPDDITQAIVNVDSVNNIDSVTSAVSTALGSSADVTNSAQQAKEAIQPLQGIQTVSLYSLIGAVAAGAVIILLAMVMIVRERRREIGVLKAIGASNVKIVGQFIAEAVTFTIIAAVVGLALGVIAGSPLTRLLVNNSSNTATATTQGPPGASNPGGQRVRAGGGRGVFGFASRTNLTNVHAAVSWDILLWGLLAAIAIAVIGSVVPSWFIAKIRPAEVMRAE